MDVLLAIVLFCFGLPLTVFLAKFKLKRRHLEKCAASIPGPKPLPIVGNALLFVKLKSTKDLWDIINFLLNKYGKLFKIWLGQKLIVVISDPNYVEKILSNHAALVKDSFYNALAEVSPGIISLNGKEWQVLRRPLMKFFRTQVIENSIDTIYENAEILCGKLEGCLEKGEININGFLKLCILDIILRTHMGIDSIHEQKENKFEFSHHIERIIDITAQRLVVPLYWLDIIFNLTKNGRELRRKISSCNEMCTMILKKRTEILNSTPDVNIDENPECYTDIVYTSGKLAGKTIDEIASKLTDFIVAGSETTGTTLAETILNLAIYPEIQEKVYEELNSIFGTSGRPPTIADINSMTYLNMVLKEAQRFRGIPGIFRVLSKDISLDEYTMPAGATMYLQLFKMHRDMRYWECPNKFYPEHFLPEAVAKRPKSAYMPFSNGPRGCPGGRYGEILMLTTLSTLLRKFFFTTQISPDRLEFKYAILLEPVEGYNVAIHKRS